MAGDVVIQGDRLVLRALRPAEVDAEWQAMAAGAAGRRGMTQPPHGHFWRGPI